jgi:propanol-preferring alcohol dehydrogenase
MVLSSPGGTLQLEERPDPRPGPGDLLIRVEACGVCRTDVHILDGDLPGIRHPIVPGHEIVGIVEAVGRGVPTARLGTRVGVPWLGGTCGHCPYCAADRENLCDRPVFTGLTRDGGFATHVVASSDFSFALKGFDDPVAAAPLLCAGLIGWRSLKLCGEAHRIGLYGFGAAAHIIAQVCRWQGREVHAFTRPGDCAAQAHARSLGAIWAGGSDEIPPHPLDAAILFAPVGDLPSFPYRLLWEERQLLSVANLTREDAREFLALAPMVPVRTTTTVYPLASANQAISDLRSGAFQGAAVLVP